MPGATRDLEQQKFQDEGANIDVAVRTASVAYSQKLAYDASNNLEYLGIAKAGEATSSAAWQIKKFFYDGNNNLITVQLADGDTRFDNIWDNRASLSYS